MPAANARHQHRQYKTLITLVVAMTGGTFFLYGIGKLTPVVPVTPLRAEARTATTWTGIDVRTHVLGTARGFYHYRIDERGRLSPSNAWVDRLDPSGVGTIQVLITSPSEDGGVTEAQTKQLSSLVSSLRSEYQIPRDRILTKR